MKFIEDNFNLEYLDKLIKIIIMEMSPYLIVLTVSVLGLPLTELPMLWAYMSIQMLLVYLPNIDVLKRYWKGLKQELKRALKIILAIIVMIILTASLVLLCEYIGNLLGIENMINTNEQSFDESIRQYPVSYFFYVVLLGPVIEEIEYRHVIPAFFKNRKMGIIISNMFFASSHFSSMAINEIIYFPVYFTIGLFLSYLYEKTKDLNFSKDVHQVYNASSILSKILGF